MVRMSSLTNPAAGPAVVAFVDSRGRSRRMIIRLDLASHIPPYEQLRAQLAVMITAGLLEPATRLPTVRDMAEVLSVSPGTVARAYRELAADELVTGQGRNGTVVVDEPPGSEPVIERATRLAAAANTFALAVRQLGIRKAAAIDAAQRALDDLEQRET
ncbi:MAG TPA: GntR family transcriptional regulator [Acidimicrobiales bacterium]|nr:GntR family transcriptional regulator [Acidimicrobiales bacterium]